MSLLFLSRADVEALLPMAECIEVVEEALRTLTRESALAEAGDFLLAREEGAVTDGHILGELGEVLERKVPGRQSAEEVTLFKSLGIAVEDLAAGRHVYRKARKSSPQV